MKKFFCLFALIFCLAAPEIFGQAGSLINVRFRLSADTATMTAYPMPPEREKDKSIKTLILKMNYNESGILNSKDAEILNSGLCNVISVDLVYTHDGNEELLETLNKRRLFELYMISPDLLGRTMVKWRFVKQLGDGQNVRNMFHGYVIRYRKIKPYRPLSLASLKEDVMALAAKPFDNDLFKIFRRIKNVEHQAIVVDFTGSMSPYFTQLMAWFFLQKYTVPTSFVFFNDGNDKPDNKKVIGKTGGLYSFRTDNLDTLLFYSLRTVDSGSGGDSPENNVEAVLQAISENPKVEKIILVADNWADMRDYSLIGTIKKPVSVILCGTSDGINTQYIDLARSTGGSLHTIEEDIENLMKIREGSEVKIGKDVYILNGGRFRKK